MWNRMRTVFDNFKITFYTGLVQGISYLAGNNSLFQRGKSRQYVDAAEANPSTKLDCWDFRGVFVCRNYGLA
jgi:hypothetical protein